MDDRVCVGCGVRWDGVQGDWMEVFRKVRWKAPPPDNRGFDLPDFGADGKPARGWICPRCDAGMNPR